MSITVFFLPAILFIGLITSYEDIKIGKIRHRWILAGIFYSVILYSILFLLSRFSIINHTINPAYVRIFVINFSISVIAAYFLWKGGVWAAGDAKLFIVYTLLLPIEYYSKIYIPYFPSFTLIMNIFVPLFLIIFAAAVFKSIIILWNTRFQNKNIGMKIKALGAAMFQHRAKLINKLVGRIVLFTVLMILYEELSKLEAIALDKNLLFIAIIFLCMVISGVIEKHQGALLLLLYVIAAYFGYRMFYLKDFSFIVPLLVRIVKILLIVGGVNGILKFYIKRVDTKKIDVKALKPYMILSKEAIKNLKRALKEDWSNLGVIYPDGISQEQRKKIVDLYIKRGYNEIEIYKTFPFAMWIFIGVLITIIMRGEGGIYVFLRIFRL